MSSSSTPRALLAMVLAVLGTAVACANTSTECETPFTSCGSVCCQAGCASPGVCEVPAGGGGGGGSSSSSSGIPGTDPECESEQDISKKTFCDSIGRCVDTNSDDEHCGNCDNVCGQDTNGNQLSCRIGRCR